MACGERHTLRMIAGAGGDHPAPPFVRGQVGDPVIGTAQLVAEDRLQILALEKDVVAKTPRKAGRRVERRFLGHVVDTTGQDQPEHLVRRRRPLVSATCHRVVDTGWIWIPHSSFCPCQRPDLSSDGSSGRVVQGSHPMLVYPRS